MTVRSSPAAGEGVGGERLTAGDWRWGRDTPTTPCRRCLHIAFPIIPSGSRSRPWRSSGSPLYGALDGRTTGLLFGFTFPEGRPNKLRLVSEPALGGGPGGGTGNLGHSGAWGAGQLAPWER